MGDVPTSLDNDFVGVFENTIDAAGCQHVIRYFENFAAMNLTFNRSAENVSREQKDDDALAITSDVRFIEPGAGVIRPFLETFWRECWRPYADKYSVLHHVPQLQILTMKIQRTQPGGGYHVWHFEDSCRLMQGRVLVFITYLNDVPDDGGGETEFLYLGRRIQPKAGRTVLFPAGFTHSHRGNPPLKGVKYILTGWIEWAGC